MTLLSPWRRADGSCDRGGRQSGLGTFHKVRWRRHLGWDCQKWKRVSGSQDQSGGANGHCDGGDAVAAAGIAVSSGGSRRKRGDGPMPVASFVLRTRQRGRRRRRDSRKGKCVPISATAFWSGWGGGGSCVARSTGSIAIVSNGNPGTTSVRRRRCRDLVRLLVSVLRFDRGGRRAVGVGRVFRDQKVNEILHTLRFYP